METTCVPMASVVPQIAILAKQKEKNSARYKNRFLNMQKSWAASCQNFLVKNPIAGGDAVQLKTLDRLTVAKMVKEMQDDEVKNRPPVRMYINFIKFFYFEDAWQSQLESAHPMYFGKILCLDRRPKYAWNCRGSISLPSRSLPTSTYASDRHWSSRINPSTRQSRTSRRTLQFVERLEKITKINL